jgi:putative endonuclease
LTSTKNTGNWGEEQALAWLRDKNYDILAVNWRFGKLEIDIVAQHGQFIVFIEVKTRFGEDFGEPADAVSLKKQRFLIKAANQYILEKEIDLEARFDIISVLVLNNATTIKHFTDAFYPIVK